MEGMKEARLAVPLLKQRTLLGKTGHGGTLSPALGPLLLPLPPSPTPVGAPLTSVPHQPSPNDLDHLGIRKTLCPH